MKRKTTIPLATKRLFLTIDSQQIAQRLVHIQEHILAAKERRGLSQAVKIVAVTKTRPKDIFTKAYIAGIRAIGENRVKEAEEKFTELPELPDLERRLIGHLQSNKARRAIELFNFIDSVDSIKLANKISKTAVGIGLNINVLLEINISGEATKFGFNPQDEEALLACIALPGIQVNGLMTVGPLTNVEAEIRKSFISLRELMKSLNTQILEQQKKLVQLSMGMSGDYRLAVEEGSTMVRIGTALFGPRRI